MRGTRVQQIVQSQIGRTQKGIEQKRRELRALQGELGRLRKAASLLGASGGAEARGPRKKVDWDKALARMPKGFTISELAATRAGKARSRAYLHQVVLRWKKKKLISSVGKGKYQKA
ncbi:MAG: hypothetical protein ACE5JJ_11115 [Nitrospinota bacterium]